MKNYNAILTERLQKYAAQLTNLWRNTTFWSKGVIEQTNFGYFALGKALEKQTKVTEDQG